MSHPTEFGAATGDVAATWVQKYTVDFTSEAAVDIRAGAVLTDTAGVTWDIADATVDGEGNASVLGTDGSTGLVVTTSASSGEARLLQLIQTVLASYALTDRIAIIVDMSSADQTQENQVTSFRFGDDPFTDGANQIFRIRSASTDDTKQNRKQADPGNFNSNVVVLDTAGFHDVLGFDISGDLCTPYYGASVPAAPFTGLTAGNAQSMMRQPDDDTAPYTAALASFQIAVNRNSASANYTMLIKSITLWRWE